ncbi:LLM class flavin-dependent oxidoreductase [Musicola paradisiaca]|uniref:Luciferase-like domain-containing protein n=1 Tax=Musicola paradisiaca (strain Ech703) TaxID=579405 RepID=C6CCJ7_MUSP7|nr:LLM class flavin-dependent oxidoreductase [Musicola paradisiaca]ACS86840.1 conserved hypothetical protein [Musicola paradisiaca Ech703]
MEINAADRAFNVFTVVSRHTDLQTYTGNLKFQAQECDRLGFTGMLFFVGNDTPIDPWLAAAQVAADTTRLSPFIALNPVYMHPFSAARAIATLSYLYQRRVYINLIAGASLAAHDALGDVGADHQCRYARLLEYTRCVRSLLSSRRPHSFTGQYYQLKDLQLPLFLPEALQPGFFVSGHSARAQEVAGALGCDQVAMISPQLENPLGRGGVYLGMVTKASVTDAWREAHRLFLTDEIGQQVVAYSMKYTDAQWKNHLYQQTHATDVADGYWIAPFENGRADCPYVVQDHRSMAGMVARLVRQGTTSFIIDLPEESEQLVEIAQVFTLARALLSTSEDDLSPIRNKGGKHD